MQLFRASEQFTFHRFILRLAKFRGQDVKILPLIVTAHNSQKTPRDLGQLRRGNAGFKRVDSGFGIAGDDVIESFVDLTGQCRAADPTLGGKNGHNIPGRPQTLADGGGELW